MIQPRVSVLTSIFKASEFLFDFLVDAKRQSIFAESEFLLLDANEDDEDFKIINQFLGYKNFKYIKIGKCSIYEAWNIGIEHASSSILTNWNVDDRRSYNSLEYQVEFLEKNEQSDVCYGPVLISEKPNEIFEFCESKKIWPVFDGTLENQLKHNSPHCLPVWRKCIHDRFGLFDTNYFSAGDYDMWFRVLKGGGTLSKLDQVVGLYYENPTSISRNSKTIEKALQEVSTIYEKYKNL
jgi:hypothetical protein